MINGMSILTPGKTINLRMDGVDGETLLLMLDGKGVCVSAGSACRSHEAEPSHVFICNGNYPKMKRGLPSEFRSQRKHG